MSVNGIWKIEMLGPYGWDSLAIAFFEDGVYRSGSENHYTVGTYQVTGNRIDITAKGYQYGKIRTVFGKKEKNLHLKFDGEIDGDVISGEASDPSSAYQISYRATRLADLA